MSMRNSFASLSKLSLILALTWCFAGCNDDSADSKTDDKDKTDKTVQCNDDKDCANQAEGKTHCDTTTNECVKPAVIEEENCGNSKLDGNELCDNTVFKENKTACTDWSGVYESGYVKCKNDCTIDYAECVSKQVASCKDAAGRDINHGATSCVNENESGLCQNGEWVDISPCPNGCNTSEGMCIASPNASPITWCWFKHLESDGSAAYVRIYPPEGSEISAKFACVADNNKGNPISTWSFIPAVDATNGCDETCGVNKEYKATSLPSEAGVHDCVAIVSVTDGNSYICPNYDMGDNVSALVQYNATTIANGSQILAYTGTGSVSGSDCGNDELEGAELCDLSKFKDGKTTCSAWNSKYSSGNVSCNKDCTINYSACVESSMPACPNGGLDDGEECDGSVYREHSSTACSLWDPKYQSGNVSCNSNCTVNYSNCVEAKECEDGEATCSTKDMALKVCRGGHWELEPCPADKPYCKDGAEACSSLTAGTDCDIDSFIPFVTADNKLVSCQRYETSTVSNRSAVIVIDSCNGECKKAKTGFGVAMPDAKECDQKGSTYYWSYKANYKVCQECKVASDGLLYYLLVPAYYSYQDHLGFGYSINGCTPW